MKTNLNDLYFSACVDYTSYVQTGVKGFKVSYESKMAEYKRLGGKRDKPHYVK